MQYEQVYCTTVCPKVCPKRFWLVFLELSHRGCCYFPIASHDSRTFFVDDGTISATAAAIHRLYGHPYRIIGPQFVEISAYKRLWEDRPSNTPLTHNWCFDQVSALLFLSSIPHTQILRCLSFSGSPPPRH